METNPVEPPRTFTVDPLPHSDFARNGHAPINFVISPPVTIDNPDFLTEVLAKPKVVSRARVNISTQLANYGSLDVSRTASHTEIKKIITDGVGQAMCGLDVQVVFKDDEKAEQ